VPSAAAADANHPSAAPSNAMMRFVFTRAPLPDAPYWSGRRLLALADAVAWPAGWLVIATHLPQPAGIAGPVVMVCAVWSGVGRAYRAAWHNHRYHFTTWPWGRVAAGVLLFDFVLKVAMQA
jgi:hypothetical protein